MTGNASINPFKKMSPPALASAINALLLTGLLPDRQGMKGIDQ
ncbi:Uncharacterised protein [Salmonella bongori]|nr:Uncharacterised protein [Salmonella bongori]